MHFEILLILDFFASAGLLLIKLIEFYFWQFLIFEFLFSMARGFGGSKRKDSQLLWFCPDGLAKVRLEVAMGWVTHVLG